MNGTAPPAADLDQLELWDPMIVRIFDGVPEQRGYWISNQPGSITDGFVLKRWNQRRHSTTVV